MTTVDLTPNFTALRHQFTERARLEVGDICRTIKAGAEVRQGDVRNMMVYLNIAFSAADSTEALIEFREAFATFAHAISEANDEANTVAIKDIVID